MDLALTKHLEQARLLANLLDTRFKFLGINFGLDPLLDLIPGIGNIIAAFTSMYIFWIGLQMKLPRNTLYNMLANIALDYFLGVIPVIGFVGDLFYKSNQRNIRLIDKYLNTSRPQ